MQRLTLVAMTAAMLVGCASAPVPVISTYSYDSAQHSGTVQVTDKSYMSPDITCETGWRDSPMYKPKGLGPFLDNMVLSIHAVSDSGAIADLAFEFPQEIGSQVFSKDYQVGRSYMLGTESNGMVSQGDHFFYPEGYYVRVSNPTIEGDVVKACIGLDRMYVLDADLASGTQPPIYLDRVVVPYAAHVGQVVTVSFGSKIPQSATIRVEPK
jgi:hypothetical protein